MTNILTLTQHIGQELIENYLIKTKNNFDQILGEQKALLESGAQTNYTIARTFELLVEKPELFCFDKNIENAQKLNAINNSLKHIEANAHKLSITKHTLSVYIKSLQEVMAQFTALIYDTLYAQIKTNNPEKPLLVIDFSEDGSIITSSDLLPDKLLK